MTDDAIDILVIAVQALRSSPSTDRLDLDQVDKGREIVKKWLAIHAPDALVDKRVDNA